MSRTLIIAEAGVNHNGSVDTACALVDAAFEAAADVVKFQTFRADQLATGAAPKAAYQERQTRSGGAQRDMLAALELDAQAHARIHKHCRTRGIEFLSTAFDDASLDLLLALDMARYKIPSGELTNLPMLRRLGALGKPLILSTGMATLGDIEAALQAVVAAGTTLADITVLQCTTDYPAAMDDVNLRAMQTIATAFGVAVGFSDHTAGIEASVAAVALGATVIEKHLTLDRTMTGPDHAASLEPDAFTAMVAAIRNVERALGNGRKVPTVREAANRVAARKSIVAARPIPVGAVLGAADLNVKRPGSGLSPMRWDEVVGSTTRRAYDTDDLIEL
ncbi:MAG: N-acetylneuraminate synthase [Gemmatimonadota bacterium]